MAFPEYKEITELTDDEVTDIMKLVYSDLGREDIVSGAVIEKITREENSGIIYIQARSAYELFEDEKEEYGEEFGWAEDNFELSCEDGLVAYDFSLGDEAWKISQKLLALGCHPLLKDNEFLS